MKGKVFTAQEVQAILNGSKVMFREVIKVQPPKGLPSDCVIFQPYKDHQHIWTIQSCGIGVKEYERRTPFSKADGIEYWRELAPYQVGQKIFCKESFSDYFALGILSSGCAFKADSPKGTRINAKWKPAQNMKKEHSRLTLLIKEIRVKRLAEIKELDATREGFQETKEIFPEPNVLDKTISAYGNFVKNWNATHKKPEEKFEASPFVWKILFEVVK